MRKLLFFVFVLLFSASVFSLSEIDCSDPSYDCEGLRLYLRFNEAPVIGSTVIHDYSSFSNDATFLGIGGSNDHAVAGVINGAVNFDGNDYANGATSSTLNIAGDITVELWLKTSSSGTIVQRYDTNSRGYAFKVNGDGRLAFYCDVYGWQFSAATVNDGYWHHAVFVGSGSVGTFYVDGVPSGNVPYSYFNDTSENFFIGAHEGFSTYFSGDMDELRVWARALSPEEIGGLHDNGYLFYGSEEEGPYIPEFTPLGLVFAMVLVLGISMMLKKRN